MYTHAMSRTKQVYDMYRSVCMKCSFFAPNEMRPRILREKFQGAMQWEFGDFPRQSGSWPLSIGVVWVFFHWLIVDFVHWRWLLMKSLWKIEVLKQWTYIIPFGGATLYNDKWGVKGNPCYKMWLSGGAVAVVINIWVNPLVHPFYIPLNPKCHKSHFIPLFH